MGKDIDAKWVQWLASRKNRDASLPSPNTASQSTHIRDSKAVNSCSTATSYFTLLSAAPYEQKARRQARLQTSSPSMDSSWVTWFFHKAQASESQINENAVVNLDETTSSEPELIHEAPASDSSLDSLHFPLYPFLNPEDLSVGLNETAADLHAGMDFEWDFDFAVKVLGG